ncbi:serine/threonine-protein kinase [Allokutzneria oryzae]|uniref:non-specific serine/threonine protein kinase n=1 Tax=Allokutzneria oryzae TaxID=1378989 RepID=A0ABV6A746_9PSEU
MAQETRPGRVIDGRYRLVRPLGAGGFGRVWEARDELLDIDVAVKELWLPPALSADEQAERLTRATREARNAAQLRDHPNVVAVHDVVIDDEIPWIIMGLVTGKSLEKHLVDGPLSAELTSRVATALLNALEAAHDAGIVHRDVKPANVLLADNGDILLADFGIAVHHTDTALTATGMLIGSVEYMAPERLNGHDGRAESDLYSLGVTLYQAVEGVSPFRRDTPTATLTAVLLEDAPPLTCTGGLATLITELLNKDPARRPDIAQARGLLEASREPTKKFEKESEQTKKAEETPKRPTMVGPPSGPVKQDGRKKGPPKRPAPVAIALGVVAVLIGWFAVRGDLAQGVSAFVDQVFSSNTTTRSAPPTTSRGTTTTTRRQTTTTPPRKTTTTTFNSADLDQESSDKTPVTASALLPSSFTDSKNVGYTRRGSDVRECVSNYMSQDVRNLLLRSGCRNAVTGTYVDRSNQILVMVWVVPMADAKTAKTAYDNYDSGAWGILCPQNGAGSEICDNNKDTSRAMRSGYRLRTHRYLVKSTAVYINLTRDNSAKPWLDAAANEAVDAAGPKNYSGNR